MKLDLLYELHSVKPWGKPHPYGQREAEQKTYFDALEQVKLADKVGFGTAWFVEHHFREPTSHCPAPEVVIGALSQVTTNIRLGFGVTLTPHPFRHPVLNAERIATADLLSRGRVEWGTGRSTPMERIAFGARDEDTRAQWKEAIEIIVKAWGDEHLAVETPYLKFPALPRGDWEPPRTITPKPFQDPHPPCWVACVSEDSVDMAANNGLGMLSLTLVRPVDELAQRIKRYRELIKDAKPLTKFVNNKVVPYTLVHCAPDMDKAQEEYNVWGSVAWWYTVRIDFAIQWELPPMSEDQLREHFPMRDSARDGTFDPRHFAEEDQIIVGDVEECREKIERYQRIGCDAIACYMEFGGLPHESIMTSIELLGTKIIPQLEKEAKSFAVDGRASTASPKDAPAS
jgi:alkanesulfonate monooxygenase SsuD/methylene tetrahydromethanopterin reductase-like flavin-dependent oxidoreductase (luciferase family)